MLIALAALLAPLGLVACGGDDDDSKVEEGKATEVSVKELKSFAEEQGHPVYWAGTVPGYKLEVTKTKKRNIALRYLPDDVAIGRKAAYTTVGTYPMTNAFTVAQKVAKERGAVKKDAPGGGIAVTRKSRPKSVYLAYPALDVIIEVYAAKAKQAQQLAVSGRVGRVE